jgi:tetratricopeptide (TPR) repeat protein
VAWAEELLPPVIAAELAILPEVYTAAAYCAQTGRTADAIRYAQAALDLGQDPRFTPAAAPSPSLLLASAYAFSGAVDRALEICREVADNEAFRAQGLSSLLLWSAFGGRHDVAQAVGEQAVAAARARGSPFWLAQTLWGYGRALADVDPNRAIAVYHEGLEYSRAHRLTFFENGFLREAAVLESRHGDPDRALDMLDEVLAATHLAGDTTDFTITMAHMARLLANLGHHVSAAVLAGWTDAQPSGRAQADHAETVADLYTTLGAPTYDRSARAGADMDAAQALAFERDEVAARREGRSPIS